MANKERGEVSLTVNNTVYILKPTTNAICEMEEASGKTFQDILQGISGTGSGSFRNIRLFLWGLLRAHHPELTIMQAGDLIDEAGGILGIVGKLEQAILINTPKAAKDQGRAGNPRKARVNGTGDNSTSTPAALV